MDPEVALLDAIDVFPERVESGDKHLDIVSPRLPMEKTRFYIYEGFERPDSRENKKRGREYSFDVRMEEQRTKSNGNSMIVVCGYLSADEEGVPEDVFLLVDDNMNNQYGKVSGKPYTPNFYQSTIKRAINLGVGIRGRSRKDYGKDGESMIVTKPDRLVRGIEIHSNLPQIRQYLHRKLPPDWRESAAKAQQIERVVEEFLSSTNPSEEIPMRRQVAQEIVAEQQNIKTDTVRQKSGSQLWHRDSNDYQTEFFDQVLKEIEEEINLDTAVPASVERATTGSIEDLEPKSTSSSTVSYPDWTDPDHLSSPQEGDELPETKLHIPDRVQSEKQIEERVDAVLQGGNHLILTGPPGSGKTQLAKELCEHYRPDDYVVSTATNDWTTFDTVGGYRPETDGDGLRFVPGLFLDRFETDNDGVAVNEWLVVDELNRADIDQAFGSLLTVLTRETVTLPFETDDSADPQRIRVVGNPDNGATDTPDTYRVPSDWRLIATMNSVDKASLYRMSYAFMRRFAFVNVPVPTPEIIDPELVGEYLGCWDIDPESYDTSEVDLSEHESFERKLCEDLGLIWTVALEQGAEFGPGVIRDIVEHALTELQTTDSLGYDQAIASHLLPQFEGQRDDEIESLFSRLENNGTDGFDNALGEIESPEDITVSRQFARSHLGTDLGDQSDE